MKLTRDPAFYAGLATAILQFLSLFFLHLTAGQQSALNAVFVAAAGFVTAAVVRRDGQVAAIIGVAQAIVSGVLYFGVHWTADQQASIMTLVALVAAAFIRTQVTAKVSADGAPQ